jgi:hypothetical protein
MYEDTFASNQDDDELGTTQSLPAELRDYAPNLFVVLGGKLGSKKEKTRPIAPATLIIFARDGGVGFVIAPKESPKNGYGFVREPMDLLQQIEAEIAAGNIGWKVPGKKRY